MLSPMRSISPSSGRLILLAALLATPLDAQGPARSLEEANERARNWIRVHRRNDHTTLFSAGGHNLMMAAAFRSPLSDWKCISLKTGEAHSLDDNHLDLALRKAMGTDKAVPVTPIRLDADGRVATLYAHKKWFAWNAPSHELTEDDADAPRLKPAATWGRSRPGRGRSAITFRNDLSRDVRLFRVRRNGRPQRIHTLAPKATHTVEARAGQVFLGDFSRNDLTGAFRAQTGLWVASFDEESRQLLQPDAQANTKRGPDIRIDGNKLRVTDEQGTNFRIAVKDGDRFRRPTRISKSGRYCSVWVETPSQERKVTLVESSPKDQVQPKVHQFQYLKPGDRVAQRRPAIIDLQSGAFAFQDDPRYANSWTVTRPHWSRSEDRFYCLYNQRGHRLLRLDCIDPTNGSVRTVIEERQETFVDYSQKTYLHFLEGDRHALWTSERSGFNHLYRVDLATGKFTALTSGTWNVRRVGSVDETSGHIWITAVGIHPDQDPYHEHLVKVDLDGGGAVPITTSDGTHTWEWSPDRQHVIVRWSRVDHPVVAELRDARDGRLLHVLWRDTLDALTAEGYRPPERFTAKGRDGKTDIWGIIIRPSWARNGERFPILENIYAGPHDHHVPKSFGIRRGLREMAEMGFVVLKIDGMGTNWRGKAFHDVCHKNLKDAGLPDRILWIKAAARKHREMDISRVGIYGGSAGGQNAMSAVLHHGGFYKAAAADCGCHDNRMDKIWWNEAWMGWPLDEAYADNSNVTHAHKLQGALFLTVGELDRNVDPASTLQVVDALIKAKKPFEFHMVPGGGHGSGESDFMRARRADFFLRHLGEPGEPK